MTGKQDQNNLEKMSCGIHLLSG